MKLYLIIAACCAGMINFSHTTQVAQQREKPRASKPIDHALDKVLLKAARKGDLQKIEKLFTGDTIPDVNAADYYSDYTSLIYAVYNCHAVMAQALISIGANVNVADEDGATALQLALLFNHTDIAQILIAAGADVNAVDKFGNTALLRAAQGGYIDIVLMLINAGADVNSETQDFTCLMRAAQGDHIALIPILLAAGSHLEAQNTTGDTALMVAVKEDHFAFAQALIAAGANPAIKKNIRVRRYYAPPKELDKEDYERIVAAGLAERKAYLDRQEQAKKLINEEQFLIPPLNNIVTTYAYGSSPLDLPEREEKNEN